MAFASLDLLAVVKASFCSTHLRGLHRLTIQTPRRRMFVPFLAFSDAGAYRIMHADPHTGAFPGSEVMIDTLPLGEIDRQHAPLDAPFRHIKDGIEHRAHTQGARSSTTFGGGNQIFDPLPFLVSEVAWIYFFVHLHILHNLRRLFRQALRRFLKKNIPRGGPWQCGQDHCLPPAGGGWRGEPRGRLPPAPRLPAELPPTSPPPAGGRSVPPAGGG